MDAYGLGCMRPESENGGTMAKHLELTPRLQLLADWVPQGARLADVGTDHAYLPIYLCQAGILTPMTTPTGDKLCAIASDINKGPTERAALHITAEGQATKIRTICTGGLDGLDVYAPQDIVIFGMGGELILSILQGAPWIQREGTRLILQPMTHPEKLRMGLASLGFAITGETLCCEGDRIYQIICADHDPHHATPPASLAEALTGHLYPPAQKKLHQKLIQKIMAKEEACRIARNQAGQDISNENAIIASLAAMLANLQTS